MVITLQEILRDAVSSFPGTVKDWDSYLITNFINECYIAIRNEYIDAKRHEQFTIGEPLGEFADSEEIPYLKYGALSRSILQRIPVRNAVTTIICRIYDELTDDEAAWDKDTLAWKGNDLFKAITDVPAVDSSGLIFDKKDVRPYSPANGLKYIEGDIVYENGVPYRAIGTVVATSEDPLADQTDDWEQVYWQYAGIGFVDPEIVQFSRYDRKKSVIDSGGVVAAINRKDVYVSKNVTSAYIEYIPEHTWIRQFTEKFIIPDDVFPAMRSMIHQKMGASIGQQVRQPGDDNE